MFGDNTNSNATDQQQTYGDPAAGNPPIANDAVTTGDQTAPELPAVPTPHDDQQSGVASDYGAADHQQPAEVSAPAPEVTAQPASTDTPDDILPTPSSSAAGTDDLLNIKQQALQQLTPLVDHLDQSPKEEFRTTMMMIQATDNQELIKKAFDAAQKIEDDKERAQAFLDIINEINYFTQHHEQQ